MAANRENFLLVTAWYEPLKGLPAVDKAEILDAIFQYHITGDLPELSPAASMAFNFMKNTFDDNHRKYLERCERNRENGSKGGRPSENQDEPKKPSGLNGIQVKPSGGDNDNEYDSDINIIVDYLNLKAQKSFKTSTKPTQKSIIARLKDGYSIEDLKRVIDVKCSEWLNTNMEQYLRPNTLFNPTNFESYFNQKPKNGHETLKPLTGAMR